jgi:hypothetical protein
VYGYIYRLRSLKSPWYGLPPGASRENRRVDEEPDLRPLPPPPLCRGIPLGDGFTGKFISNIPRQFWCANLRIDEEVELAGT